MNIREALERLGADASAPEGSQAWTLAEVRAAVAELIEAVRNWQEQRHGADADDGSRAMRRYDESCDRLDAALARVQGDQ